MSKPKTISEVLDNLLQDFTDALSDDGVTADPRVKALQAIEDIMKKQVIGEDEKPVPIVPGTWFRSHNWQGFRAMERFRNTLRKEQRANLSKALRGDER